MATSKRTVATTTFGWFVLLVVGLGISSFSVEARRFPKPDISIGFNIDHDARTGTFGGASPRVRWDSNEVSVAGCFDVQGGIDATVNNLETVPDTYVWGEAKRINPKSAVAIRGDVHANHFDVLDLDLRVNALSNTLGLRLLGTAYLRSQSLVLDRVLASTQIESPLGLPGRLTVNPEYDPRSRTPDATLGYSLESTSVRLEARGRRITLSQALGRNRIVPTLDARRKTLSVMCARDLGRGSGTVAATWTPNDSVSLKWTDGSWEATLRAPLEGSLGCRAGDVHLSVKQSVGVSLY